MSAGPELPPPPDAPPVPDVVYTPKEAVAWIRTMTPEALVKAARRDPARFPSTKPGSKVGFSGADIIAIVAATSRTPSKATPGRTSHRRVSIAAVPDPPTDSPRLVARPQAARLNRNAS